MYMDNDGGLLMHAFMIMRMRWFIIYRYYQHPLAQYSVSQVHQAAYRIKPQHPSHSLAHHCSSKSYQAQQQLTSLQGVGGIYFAGAWAGYGFHEDGIRAGVAVAQALGAPTPWTPITTSPKMGLADRLFLWLFDR